MTNYKTRIATAIATGSVLLHALAPMTLAATEIRITGNGSDSNNTANVSQNSSLNVVQNNTANVNNNVTVNATTGSNNANDNTGGDVEIETGDASTDVTVKNALNSNAADVQNCGACAGDTKVVISGNGSDSDNDVDLDQSHSTNVFQYNNADIDNDVDVDAETGDNDANDNTGGDVKIKTGDADTTVKIMTAANANSAVVGGGDEAGEVSAYIVGNGSDADNDVNLGFYSSLVLTQDNDADVDNDVDVDAETGDNDANDNTGGDVIIDTGDADADVTVDNMVNFNAADAGCGCVFDVLAKIDGNGSDSDSEIYGNFGDATSLFQDNGADLDNDVDVDGDTGDNEADDNTGAVDGVSDPAITTGDADATVHTENSGNQNVIGSADLPDFEFDFNMNMWSLFMSWMSSHN